MGLFSENGPLSALPLKTLFFDHFQSSNKLYQKMSDILNLEGHLNCCIGSKVTALLLNGGILPTGEVASERVCPAACAALMQQTRADTTQTHGIVSKYISYSTMPFQCHFRHVRSYLCVHLDKGSQPIKKICSYFDFVQPKSKLLEEFFSAWILTFPRHFQ